MKSRSLLTSLTGFTIAAALALTGCSAGDAPDAGGDEKDATAAFLACLTSAGMVAKVGDQGMVLVKDAKSSANDSMLTYSGDSTAIMTVTDDSGAIWVAPANADYFADDPAAKDTYSSCEKKHASFAQPQFDPNKSGPNREWTARQAELALAFAQCARTNGFTQIADPAPAEAGSVAAIVIPDGFTETEFRALIDACWEPENSFVIGAGEKLDFSPWAVLEELENARAQ